MRVFVMGLFATACLAFTPAAAQDAVKAAPNVFRTVGENPRVRVLEATLKPGDKVPPHSLPDHMLYALTEGVLVLKPQGRTPYEMTLKPGEALFLPAQTRAAENDGDKSVRVLIVEFKAPASIERPDARSSRKASGQKSRGRSRSGYRSRRR